MGLDAEDEYEDGFEEGSCESVQKDQEDQTEKCSWFVYIYGSKLLLYEGYTCYLTLGLRVAYGGYFRVNGDIFLKL